MGLVYHDNVGENIPHCFKGPPNENTSASGQLAVLQIYNCTAICITTLKAFSVPRTHPTRAPQRGLAGRVWGEYVVRMSIGYDLLSCSKFGLIELTNYHPYVDLPLACTTRAQGKG